MNYFTNQETGGLYADNYISTTSQGCFTTPVSHVHTNECPYTWTTCGGTYTTHMWVPDPEGNYIDRWACNRCGALGGSAGGTCNNNVKKITCTKTIDGYSRSCGKCDGKLVGAHILYN